MYPFCCIIRLFVSLYFFVGFDSLSYLLFLLVSSSSVRRFVWSTFCIRFFQFFFLSSGQLRWYRTIFNILSWTVLLLCALCRRDWYVQIHVYRWVSVPFFLLLLFFNILEFIESVVFYSFTPGLSRE